VVARGLCVRGVLRYGVESDHRRRRREKGRCV